MQVIGAGVGRTGTYSLKLALEQLRMGPCYHMEAVLHQMQPRVPQWLAALDGDPDWPAIYDGYHSAVDWPTAAFFRELVEVYPHARFVLTHRSPESWADSFGATIYQLIYANNEPPPEIRGWLDMAAKVIARNGFPAGLDRDAMIESFVAHNEAVRSAVPAGRLLEFEVKNGWGPLCEFLELPEPDGPFPRSNDRSEFWDLIKV